MIPVREKSFSGWNQCNSQSKQNKSERQIKKNISQAEKSSSDHHMITICCSIQILYFHTFHMENCMLDILKHFLQIKLKRVPTNDDIQKYCLVLSSSKIVYPLEMSIEECKLVNGSIFESNIIF